MSSSSRLPFQPSLFAQLAKKESSNWWFRSRNQILMWYLATKNKHFLSFHEIGCGTAYVLEGVRKAYPDAQLFGSEYFEEGLLFARARVPSAKFRQLDATMMGDVDSFDVIGAFDVIEHVEQDEQVLANIARALKPGGAVMITVPQHRWLWSVVDEQACHVRRYTRSELVGKIKGVGLSVEYVTSFVSLLVPLMYLVRLRVRPVNYEPLSEFKIPKWLNWSFEAIMKLEFMLLKIGVRFPVGGSLFLVAKKHDPVQ
ncbi:MAG: class I SAM-dependent methyltransferase [Desulfobulbaceae bacterium]|nr:MAG: class I SAM-dependent methyltransferase [Desulfobulbaceae bacterium]